MDAIGLAAGDLWLRGLAGPEPVVDPVLREFLCNSGDELLARCRAGGLLNCANLGGPVPWLWRLTFRTRGLVRRPDGEVDITDQYTVLLRFLPDYLRQVERFDMLRLVAPLNAWHPNIQPPYICVQIVPGETLVEICESLHALFAWRLRQLAENDALNKAACAWGRQHLDQFPIDDRPLFGRRLPIALEAVEGGT